jgi:hypothetical protein
MIIQRLIAPAVKGLSRLLRNSSGTFTCSGELADGTKHSVSTESHFYRFGPRILVIRDGQVQRLTGLFAIVTKYENGVLTRCLPALFDLEGGDELHLTGVQRKYRALNPPLLDREPMFRDGDGTCFG